MSDEGVTNEGVREAWKGGTEEVPSEKLRGCRGLPLPHLSVGKSSALDFRLTKSSGSAMMSVRARVVL